MKTPIQAQPLRDIFRPVSEPAQTIYDAFQKEASLRKGRQPEEWIQAELEAVHQAAIKCAQKFGLKLPTIEMAASAEIYARGSVDYGSQWAHCLVRKMKEATR